MTDRTLPPPAVVDQINELHRLSGECGFEDRVWGALVIAAMVIVEAKARIDAEAIKKLGGWPG